MPDETPHPSNSRATIPDDPGTWFGFEQEYFLYQDGAPLGFPREGFPPPQGEYYTGVGYKNVGDIAREIVDAHLDLCLEAGINHEGINAEVAKGQWEFQIFGKGSKRAADEMWIARYLLLRLCEKYRVDVNFHPKPLGMDYDWNGSGMHTNFSTEYLREVGGKEYFEALMTAFDEYKDEHIAVYGPDNHMRLTGLHETQAIDKFNYGIANRGASVRVPHSFVKNGYRGYLEDRRPNSLGDPYQIAGRILQTIETVPVDGAAVPALVARWLATCGYAATSRRASRLLDLEDDRDVRRHVLRSRLDRRRRRRAASPRLEHDRRRLVRLLGDRRDRADDERAGLAERGRLRLRVGERVLRAPGDRGRPGSRSPSVGPSIVFAPAPTAASISCPAFATPDSADTESCAE